VYECVCVWVCVWCGRVSVRVTAAGAVFGAGRGASGSQCAGEGPSLGSASFLLSVSTFQSQPACFPQPLSLLSRPAGLPRFSSFQPPWV
jgi:hypothetical protein